MTSQSTRLANLLSILLLSVLLYSPLASGATLNRRNIHAQHKIRAQSLNTDQAAALKVQNDGRRSKNLTELIWDDSLTEQAQVWANYLASINSMQHSSGDQRVGEGENLAWAWTSAPGGIKTPLTQGATGWMNEASSYHNEIIPQGSFSSYGHYTQCMWSSTTKIGMANATAANGGVYTVGRYSPAGNFVGQRPY